MAEISITVDDRQLQQRLNEIEEALGDEHLALVMNDIGEQMVESIKQHIERNETWSGGQFAPNKPTTLARKRGSQPLLDSRIFVTSRIFYQASGNAVTIGASAIQSAVLQFSAKKGAFGKTKRGAPIPWGDIPARRYMPISDDGQLVPAAHERVLTVIEEYVDSITR